MLAFGSKKLLHNSGSLSGFSHGYGSGSGSFGGLFTTFAVHLRKNVVPLSFVAVFQRSYSSSGFERGPKFKLILDFDGTLTKEDTTMTLHKVATFTLYETCYVQKMSDREALAAGEIHKSRFEEYYTEYRKALHDHTDRAFKEEVKARDQNLTPSYDALLNFFRRVGRIEHIGVKRAEQSAIVKGMNKSILDNWCSLDDAIALRSEAFRFIKKHAILQPFDILSACWSSQLITIVLEKERVIQYCGTIHSNKLKFIRSDRNLITASTIIGNIHSAVDKMNEIKEKYSKQSELPVVYIGDSLNDLLAMLHVNIGIWLDIPAEESEAETSTPTPTTKPEEEQSEKRLTLPEVCQAFKIELIPLPTLVGTHFRDWLQIITQRSRENEENKFILVAKSWKEVSDAFKFYEDPIALYDAKYKMEAVREKLPLKPKCQTTQHPPVQPPSPNIRQQLPLRKRSRPTTQSNNKKSP